MKLMILGASGLVGSLVLQEALREPRITAVVAPTRRPLAVHDKLTNVVADDLFALPAQEDWWVVDAVICALGTTRKIAGSAEAFVHIDRDLPLLFARRTLEHGAGTFCVISSIGADAASRFLYTRTKGELEDELGRVGFGSLTIVRPGLIVGERRETRLIEDLTKNLLVTLKPILPESWKPNSAVSIARALMASALQATPGRHVVEAQDLQAFEER